MGYQLPQELKTTKLNSLTGDAKTLAEEVVAEKFGIGEVVSSRATSTSPKFNIVGETSVNRQHTYIEMTFGSSTGRTHRMMLPLSQYDAFSYRHKDAYIESVMDKIYRELQVIQNSYGLSRIDYIRARIDNNEIALNSLSALRDFIYDNFKENGGVS